MNQSAWGGGIERLTHSYLLALNSLPNTLPGNMWASRTDCGAREEKIKSRKANDRGSQSAPRWLLGRRPRRSRPMREGSNLALCRSARPAFPWAAPRPWCGSIVNDGVCFVRTSSDPQSLSRCLPSRSSASSRSRCEEQAMEIRDHAPPAPCRSCSITALHRMQPASLPAART